MRLAIATIATLAGLAASLPAFATTAPKEAFVPVPRSVIDRGPVPTSGDWWADAQAEQQYLRTVCPTVIHTPKQYSATLVRFCRELPPA